MMFVPYNLNIPDAPNNPSNDQPDMKINTNAINTLFDIDHYSFNQNEGGVHKQVIMPIRGLVQPGSIPPGVLANQGALYTKNPIAPVLVDNRTTQLYYTDQTSTNEYQLTVASATGFAQFATNTAYPGGGGSSGGWTFLPGGLLFQYGLRIGATASGIIVFPKAFSANPYNIDIVPRDLALGTLRVIVQSLSETTTQFGFLLTGGTLTSSLYWTAIGPS